LPFCPRDCCRYATGQRLIGSAVLARVFGAWQSAGVSGRLVLHGPSTPSVTVKFGTSMPVWEVLDERFPAREVFFFFEGGARQRATAPEEGRGPDRARMTSTPAAAAPRPYATTARAQAGEVVRKPGCSPNGPGAAGEPALEGGSRPGGRRPDTAGLRGSGGGATAAKGYRPVPPRRNSYFGRCSGLEECKNGGAPRNSALEGAARGSQLHEGVTAGTGGGPGNAVGLPALCVPPRSG